MTEKWQVGDRVTLMTSTRRYMRGTSHGTVAAVEYEAVTIARVGRAYVDVVNDRGHVTENIRAVAPALESRSPHTYVRSVHRDIPAAEAAVRAERRRRKLSLELRALCGAREARLAAPGVADQIAALLGIELGDGMEP